MKGKKGKLLTTALYEGTTKQKIKEKKIAFNGNPFQRKKIQKMKGRKQQPLTVALSNDQKYRKK